MSASSMDGSESVDQAALAGMLKGYDADQLVEEVLAAWNELSTKNGEIASVKQRNRVYQEMSQKILFLLQVLYLSRLTYDLNIFYCLFR